MLVRDSQNRKALDSDVFAHAERSRNGMNGSKVATSGMKAAFRSSLLEEQKPRWGEFAASAGVQVVLVLLLIWVPMLLPQKLVSVARSSVIPLLESQPLTEWKPQPPPKFKMNPPPPEKMEARVVAPVVPPKPLRELRTELPKPEAPVVAPHFQPAKFVPSPDPPRPKPEIKTGVLSNGSSAPATVNLPPHKVQTGGFGDPNGVPATGDGMHAATIARVGSFDLPPGPGYGNGTGGASGVRGTVRSAGFGNGTAIQSNGGGGDGSHAAPVQQGVFSDATQPVETTRKSAAPETPSLQPLEIVAKPNPVYTAEARQLKIEGEVLLQVVFTANGVVQVQKIVRGLGHGLDEAAVVAAQHIRFKPEQKNGKPVDSAATIHIVFQLAY
jgi:TonB family protein